MADKRQQARTGADDRAGRHVFASLEREAHGLADRLPDLVIEAMRIASTVAHGIHGRRRAGPGETFWQFRHLESTDAATLIDWRRSAASDHLYVREREWEAAHTMWVWPDLSVSMDFASDLAPSTKRDRALVLALAAAELLVRGGERVALMGVTRPSASRRAAALIAEAILANASQPSLTESLPPNVRLPRFSGVLLISDFLEPIEHLAPRLEAIAASGVAGHLVQVMDPAEETLPYTGRAEFLGPEDGQRWIVDRVETLRGAYVAKLAAHRAALAELATRWGWSLLIHHTDRPASEALLSLAMRLSGQSGSYRMTSQPAGPAGRGGTP